LSLNDQLTGAVRSSVEFVARRAGALKTAVGVGTHVITGVIILTLVHVCQSHHKQTHRHRSDWFNPLTPTVAIWVQL